MAASRIKIEKKPKEYECSQCRRIRAASEFSGNEVVCKGCVSNNLLRAGVISGKHTDISVLLSLPKTAGRASGWDVEEAEKAVRAVVIARTEGIPLRKVLMRVKGFTKSRYSVDLMIKELYLAAKAGMSLKEYFKAGRPFKKKSKVLLVT